MRTSAEPVYLDSSALVKLVVEERETLELERWLADRSGWTSCAIARTEVLRAIVQHGPFIVARARALLARVDLIPLGDYLLDLAGTIGPRRLRSLDAIHLAAASSIGPQLAFVVTYDHRMAQAAQAMGMPVIAPGSR